MSNHGRSSVIPTKLATDWIARERFVQQHFDVCLIAEPFGFCLLLGSSNFVITQTDGDFAR
jgi:hypothetical protein